MLQKFWVTVPRPIWHKQTLYKRCDTYYSVCINRLQLILCWFWPCGDHGSTHGFNMAPLRCIGIAAWHEISQSARWELPIQTFSKCASTLDRMALCSRKVARTWTQKQSVSNISFSLPEVLYNWTCLDYIYLSCEKIVSFLCWKGWIICSLSIFTCNHYIFQLLIIFSDICLFNKLNLLKIFLVYLVVCCF